MLVEYTNALPATALRHIMQRKQVSCEKVDSAGQSVVYFQDTASSYIVCKLREGGVFESDRPFTPRLM
jgi:hypothetical protein